MAADAYKKIHIYDQSYKSPQYMQARKSSPTAAVVVYELNRHNAR